MDALHYPFPHSVYTREFLDFCQHTAAGRPTLQLTASQAHATWWRRATTPAAAMYTETYTLQGFLLRSVLAATPRRVLTAYERIALVRHAWAAAGGDRYTRYSNNRGADSEMAAILSALSGQRSSWANRTDIDPRSELGRIYTAYQQLLDTAQAIAYDDLALHYNDLPTTGTHARVLCAVELHEATPAQLLAIHRLADHIPDGFLAAWLPPASAPTNPAPELAAVAAFLARYDAHPGWPTPESPAGQLITRLSGTRVAAPGVSFAAMDGETDRIGMDTSIDEVTLAARHAAHVLTTSRSVTIVCADTDLLAPLRVALRDAGVPLPLLSPGQGTNPLIRLCQYSVELRRTDDERRRSALTRACADTIRDVRQGEPQPSTSHDSADASEFLQAVSSLVLDATVPTQLRSLMERTGMVQSTWKSPIRLANAVRDHWLNEWQQWLGALDALLSLSPAGDVLDHIATIDATPTPERVLRDTALPLQLCGPNGNPAETDCLIVIGLHEASLPRTPRGFQLIAEEELRTARTEPTGYLPLRTDRHAVRQRESRRAARLVSATATEIVLSVAYAGVSGKPQLPTAFFDAWGNGELRFSPHGDLITNTAVPRLHGTPVPLPYTAPQPNGAHKLLLTEHRFSSSQLDTYLRCPRQYFYQKVAKTDPGSDDEDPGTSLSVGSLVHEILCAAMGTGQLEDVDLREETLAAFAERWQVMPERVDLCLRHALAGTSVALPRGGTYIPSKAWRSTLGEGLWYLEAITSIETILTQWYASESDLGTGTKRRPILLEHPFSTTIGGYEVTGRIDRVDALADGTLEIIDYKTGEAKSGGELRKTLGLSAISKNPDAVVIAPPAKSFQTAVYLSAPLPHPDGVRSATTMRYHYVKHKHDNHVRFRAIRLVHGPAEVKPANTNHVTAVALPHAELVQHVIPLMTTTMEEMRQTPYPIRAGRHCSWCAFAAICDAVVDDEGAEGDDE